MLLATNGNSNAVPRGDNISFGSQVPKTFENWGLDACLLFADIHMYPTILNSSIEANLPIIGITFTWDTRELVHLIPGKILEDIISM